VIHSSNALGVGFLRNASVISHERNSYLGDEIKRPNAEELEDPFAMTTTCSVTHS